MLHQRQTQIIYDNNQRNMKIVHYTDKVGGKVLLKINQLININPIQGNV